MAAILTVFFIAAGASVPSAPYAAAVRSYASGETSAAVAALREWPQTRVRDEVRAVIGLARDCASPGRLAGPDCDPAAVWPGLSIPAALMLHTDTVRAAPTMDVHDRAALTLAELMSRFPSLAGFAERWLGLRTRLARADNAWDEATSWAERGVGVFPRSAALWLLLGSIEETRGTREVSRRSDVLLFARDSLRAREKLAGIPEPSAHFAKAQRALRAALAVEPGLAEARLRVARVAWWRGDLAEARAELRHVLSTKPDDPWLAFLAQLFLGRVQEDAGELAQAAASYQAAVALHAQCQSARLARSHVLHRIGEHAGARRELEIALRSGGSRSRPDAYWLYLAPPAGAAEEELAALRREVMP